MWFYLQTLGDLSLCLHWVHFASVGDHFRQILLISTFFFGWLPFRRRLPAAGEWTLYLHWLYEAGKDKRRIAELGSVLLMKLDSHTSPFGV